MLPYASTTFLSAFLLFLVQPLIAKQILPWFGGSAAVWATCMLFFQSMLLAGYAYAHGSVRWLKPRTQTWVHIGLLVVSLASLPIIAGAGWKPAGNEDPILRILGLLVVTIGLPYLALSTTTPLLQAWYWRRFNAAVPYRLFALSNFASLLALLGYPVLVEPWFSGTHAAWLWSGMYAVFALACSVTAWISLKNAAGQPVEAVPEADSSADAKPVDKAALLQWIGLSALGSAMLLAITNHMTQNVASVPFLWVLPLALYLISFIICFDHPRWYRRDVFVPLLGVLLPLMAWMTDSLDLRWAVPLFAAGLFVACMFCHGELARAKPDPRHLTLYYLMISVGGAIGGVAVAMGAPQLLSGYYEMQIALVLLGLLALWRLWGSHWSVRAGLASVVVGVVVLCGMGMQTYLDGVRMIARDFYGVVRTRDLTAVFPLRAMYHGPINHGGQLLPEALQMEPSTYFSITSGYGRLFSSLPEGPKKVGVIGLGAGALAAYAKPGDTWVFYEIAPTVVDLAQKEFTFLSKSPAKPEIVLGDGRLALEREAPRQYDVLAIDAFSGDSIPMHLITREAMAVYLKHLKPGGVIVFQATNRFVDLPPVIRRLADEAGLVTAHVSDWPQYQSGPEYWRSSTDQVLVTRKADKAILDAPEIAKNSQPAAQRADLPTFTDDFYNLLRILKH